MNSQIKTKNERTTKKHQHAHFWRGPWLCLCLAACAIHIQARGQGTAFSYQGRLENNSAPANGVFDFRFRLYVDPQGNNQIGSAVLTNGVPVNAGLFMVTLDFGAGVFQGSNYWLELDVKTNGGASYTDLNPLQALAPVPYAVFAENAVSGGLAGGTYSNAVTLNNPGNTFAGSFTGNAAGVSNVNALTLGGVAAGAFWQLGGNDVANGQFIGSLNLEPVEVWVNDLRTLRLEPGTNAVSVVGAPNVIGGAANNVVDAGIYGATIAGGGAVDMQGYLPGPSSNHVAAIFGSIGGGRLNTIGADHSTIAGGLENTVQTYAYDSAIGGGFAGLIGSNSVGAVIGGGHDNTVLADEGTVSGGYANTVGTNGVTSVIGGGWFNTVNEGESVVAGGQNNLIQQYADHSLIGGGEDNTIIGSYSLPVYAVIAGGFENQVQTNTSYPIIGGGYDNVIESNASFAAIVGGCSNMASGKGSFVGGGGFDGTNYAGNIASGNASVVDGGCDNQATNSYSTVVGGYGNIAAGAYSFAGGKNALTTGNGSFVWNSFPNTNYAGGDNEFYVFAQNGFSVDYNDQISSGGGDRWVYLGLGSVGPFFDKTGATISTWTGAYLSDAGVWSNASDRNRKTDFRGVDPGKILDQLVAMPLTQWRYTNEDATVKHLGPTAQDFKAAFDLGSDDKAIGTVDEGGVALAAIQGLDRKLESKTAKIEEQAGEIAQLKQTVTQLQAMVAELARTRQSAQP